VATVASLHHYPVKSLTGQSMPSLELDARGVVGDRLWSVRTVDNKIGSGKTTRRFAALLGLLDLRSGVCDGDVVVTFPDGAVLAVDDPRCAERISAYVGQPVTLAQETDVMHFDDGPVSLLGLASVAALEAERGVDVAPARFRPNLVLATDTAFEEDSWLGRRVSIGTAVLDVALASPRCVMVDMATTDLPAQHGNLRTLGSLHGACLGVIASVLQAGRVSVGDVVHVQSEV
jgi:uncharacterized protein YcbX